MGLFDFLKKGKEEPAPKAPVAKPTITPPNTSVPRSEPKSQPTDSDTYTVQSGDSLSKIAKKLYGDANNWHKLYDANKTLIGDNPDMIQPGQRLTVPRN